MLNSERYQRYVNDKIDGETTKRKEITMNEDVLYPIDVTGTDKNHWTYPIYEAAYAWYRREGGSTMTFFKSSDFKRAGRWSTSETTTPIVKITSLELMGNAELINNSPEEQALKTGEFGKEITASWSSSASSTRNFGTEIEGSVNFGPKCFKVGIRIQFNMNFSYTSATTKSGSETLKYTLPAQEIRVPPYSTRYVYAILEKGKAAGKVNLLMPLQSGYRSAGVNQSGNTFYKDGLAYDLITEMAPYMQFDRISPDQKNKAILFSDEFDYTIEAAFTVKVDVRDKPLEQGGELIDSWTVKPEEIMVEVL